MKLFLSLVLMAGLLVGCDSESLQQDDPPVGHGSLKIGDYAFGDLEGDAYELRDARIDGTELKLDVAYSGGCAEHGFSGFMPQVNLTIFPPQISIYVVHDGNGDMCEAYISNTVSLDIADMLDTFGDEFTLSVHPVSSHSDIIQLRQPSR